MENQKAEQEVSALMTGMTLVGLLVPALLVWVAGRFETVALRLVEIGVLERSQRVVLEVSNGIGLDTGRILMAAGTVLLAGILLVRLVKLFSAKS